MTQDELLNLLPKLRAAGVHRIRWDGLEVEFEHPTVDLADLAVATPADPDDLLFYSAT